MTECSQDETFKEGEQAEVMLPWDNTWQRCTISSACSTWAGRFNIKLENGTDHSYVEAKCFREGLQITKSACCTESGSLDEERSVDNALADKNKGQECSASSVPQLLLQDPSPQERLREALKQRLQKNPEAAGKAISNLRAYAVAGKVMGRGALTCQLTVQEADDLIKSAQIEAGSLQVTKAKSSQATAAAKKSRIAEPPLKSILQPKGKSVHRKLRVIGLLQPQLILANVPSFKDHDYLWFQKPGAFVDCDECGETVAAQAGHLRGGLPGKRFTQNHFICRSCDAENFPGPWSQLAGANMILSAP